MNPLARPLALSLLVVFGSFGVVAVSLVAQERRMTPTDRIISVVENTRPVCIGRFIIDVPRTAQVVYGPARLPVETRRKEGEGGNLEAFVQRAVAKSKEDSWLARDGLTGSTSMLGKVIDGVTPDHKIVFGVGHGSGSFYNVQSIVSVGSDLYIQEYEEFGEDDKYLHAIQDANEIASRIVPRNEDEIPGGSGICIDGAFVREPQRYMIEAVSIGIRLKEFEGVHISIQMTKKSRHIASDAIEPRLKSAEKSLVAQGHGSWYKRINFLRRGQRKIGDWDGFEVAAHRPAIGSEEESHEFAFLSHGEPRNPMLPVLDVKLHTGVKGNEIGGMAPSITDEEALFFWDRILSSIKPRPVKNPSEK